MEVEAPGKTIEETSEHKNGQADVEDHLVMQIVEDYWLKHLSSQFDSNSLPLTLRMMSILVTLRAMKIIRIMWPKDMVRTKKTRATW